MELQWISVAVTTSGVVLTAILSTRIQNNHTITTPPRCGTSLRTRDRARFALPIIDFVQKTSRFPDRRHAVALASINSLIVKMPRSLLAGVWIVYGFVAAFAAVDRATDRNRPFRHSGAIDSPGGRYGRNQAVCAIQAIAADHAMAESQRVNADRHRDPAAATSAPEVSRGVPHEIAALVHEHEAARGLLIGRVPTTMCH